MTTRTVDKVNDKASKELAVEANKSLFDDAQLSSITTMSEALEIMGSITSVEDFADYGSGFEILDNKDRIVGVPFLILEWRFTTSAKYKQEFVSAVAVDDKDNKFIINDGSTGIYRQLRMVTDKRLSDGRPYAQAGLVCRNGLRRSDYEIDQEDGNTIDATTYYIA